MVLFKSPRNLFDYIDLQKSLFKLKQHDCILYSDDGFKINIHKDILCQTKSMQNILLSADNSCCKSIEIFCPCSSQELEILVKFLYYGKIFYTKSNDLAKI